MPFGYDTADSEPLAEALRKIYSIVDRSESDPEMMREMLDQIEDAVTEGREAWLANVRAAQDAELAELRKQRDAG